MMKLWCNHINVVGDFSSDRIAWANEVNMFCKDKYCDPGFHSTDLDDIISKLETRVVALEISMIDVIAMRNKMKRGTSNGGLSDAVSEWFKVLPFQFLMLMTSMFQSRLDGLDHSDIPSWRHILFVFL